MSLYVSIWLFEFYFSWAFHRFSSCIDLQPPTWYFRDKCITSMALLGVCLAYLFVMLFFLRNFISSMLFVLLTYSQGMALYHGYFISSLNDTHSPTTLWNLIHGRLSLCLFTDAIVCRQASVSSQWVSITTMCPLVMLKKHASYHKMQDCKLSEATRELMKRWSHDIKMISTILAPFYISLKWRHNERDGVSIHQPHDCLLNRLFRRRSKKTSNLCVTGLCAGNSPVTGEFPAQMASNAENVSIWWRHHVYVGWGWRSSDHRWIPLTYSQ